jgi:enterochelin esterase-like enzyme
MTGAWRSIAAFALVGGGAGLIYWTGTLAAARLALVGMGFDPDRARLIAALSVEAVLVMLAAFVTGRSSASILAGTGTFAVLFAHTFESETRAALRASGALGRLDPLGWLLTLCTLLGAALVIGWAASTLAIAARAWVVKATADTATVVRSPRADRALIRPAFLAFGIVALVVALPTFGDLVNYAPDVHMRAGGAPVTGLTDASTPGSPTPTTSAAPMSSGDQPTSSAAPMSAGDRPTSSPRPAPVVVLSLARPWRAWRPGGAGLVSQLTFPAPWVGGTRPRSDVWVYLPPGYRTSGRAYPVIYEVPWSYTSWSKIAITNILDGLADSGTIPGHIVVFVSEGGGPYPDSECIDTPDHRESFESYLTGTVRPYIDSHFKTVAAAAGRSVLGMSQGGFCAAMLVLRHPDLFSTAIAFSGYYVAAVRSSQTVNAGFAFDGQRSAILAYSPMALVRGVTPGLRGRLLFELSADPTNPFYGAQYQAFSTVLRAAGIPVALFPTPLGHGWTAPRAQLPQVLATLAAREVALGLYGP